MAENSNIEWTDHTFNPWIGCTKVSPACDHCYAEAWDNRFAAKQGSHWGPRADRRRTKTWGNPIKWNKQAETAGVRYRVFCASLADVFDNHRSIKPEWRDDLWELIRSTPNLDWLMLTKRPQNIGRFLPPDWNEQGYPTFHNVWLGTTVENFIEGRRRIPDLLRIPAHRHFLSCEPLLGEVDITPWLWGPVDPCPQCPKDADCDCHPDQYHTIDWVITGGESGANFRPANPEWFRSLRDQCAAASVPFLFKQWEGRSQKEIKALGRELDGVVHNGYPEIAA